MHPEFDIIFAGGGTTACVVAGRLAAADPSLKILVVESGQHSRDLPIHVQPCQFVANLAPDSTTVSFHVGKPSEHLNGRAPIMQCGRSVGGGSTVNFMVYVRGAASDYDDWAKLGNEGWSSNDLLPLMKKIETYTIKADQPTHGYSGPIQISASAMDLGVGKQFLDVAKEYDPSRPQVDDNNDLVTADAYSPWYKYIDSKTGRRSDAASRYLYPHSENANLQILVGKRVKRVIVENGRAVGIEYTNDAISCPGASTELITVKASKMVVVSGGAFGSPAILERSGIGASPILKKNEVEVVVDLPGVGENYQDHNGVFPLYYASDETTTMDDLWSGNVELEEHAAWLKEWERSGKGKIAQNGLDAMVKLRPTAAELESIGPMFQHRWETFFKHSPDKPLAILSAAAGFSGDHSIEPGRKFVCMCYYTLYPESIGTVHIGSGDDPNAPLDFDPCLFSNPADVPPLNMLYKKARELARRMPSYRGEAAFVHPQFAADSAAACKEADGPVPISAPDIVYSAEDDKAIEHFHRNVVQSTWHSLGTCAMKPREECGVVDSRLNVYGVTGLKVADMSICPTNVGNNTYSTALLVGEKAAIIIAQDLGIGDVDSVRRQAPLWTTCSLYIVSLVVAIFSFSRFSLL
ncbi:alcohol oxidase [Paxillus involutus ATCC 200175]|uniref:Alcohol oxidase n=1 Tax=Paxillus involutus ATCC 200175 TaxID=664439 RepID=A0A0C9TLK6_PAXIN|nr:alcohol oxidase [Paxillus involutus ATCC 200175]